VPLPERGHIAIFNRSHYEQVITMRVHPEHLAREADDPERAGDPQFWKAGMQTIESWERHLVSCQTGVVKFFLHISRERTTNPEKQWKFSTTWPSASTGTTIKLRTRTPCARRVRAPRRGTRSSPTTSGWLARRSRRSSSTTSSG
jgi:hypothetical protein